MTLDLAHLRSLLERAPSPRPWRTKRGELVKDAADHLIYNYNYHNNDAALIIAAVNALPELLDEVERLRDEARVGEEQMAAILDGTFATGDGTAQREIERQRAEVEKLRAALDDALNRWEGLLHAVANARAAMQYEKQDYDRIAKLRALAEGK